MPRLDEALKQKDELQRTALLVTLDRVLETPMVVLSFIMLVLFLIELGGEVSSDWRRVINLAQWFIWLAFVLEFATKLAIAPNKAIFLRRNWLMALAVLLPVLRVFRVVNAARAVRSFGALRVITVGNRSIREVGSVLRRRHLAYVGTVVAIVTLLGAAGVYFLERTAPGGNIRSFGSALWWSVGIVTTVGTELYPVTAEGRILAGIEMLFGVSVFGYVAGSLASLFIHIDRGVDATLDADPQSECSQQVLDEISRLREVVDQLAALDEVSPRQQNDPGSG